MLTFTFPFSSCRGGPAPRPVPGCLRPYHHRLRHSLFGLRAAGQPTSAVVCFTHHALTIPAAATFASSFLAAHRLRSRSERFVAFIHVAQQLSSPRKSPRSPTSDPSPGCFWVAFASTLHLHLRHLLHLRHQTTHTSGPQPARSLPAAFGGQLLQGSPRSWFCQPSRTASQRLHHHAADPYGL